MYLLTLFSHSVVFGGFAPRELAKRIDDARPKALLATSCGIEPKGPIDYKRQSPSMRLMGAEYIYRI